MEIGFSRKSSAPRRVARTAISMCRLAGHHDYGRGTPCVFRSSSSAKPSLPGMTTSERIRSKGCDLLSSSARRSVIADGGLVAFKAKCARERRERIGFVVNNQQVRFLRHDVLL